MMEEQAFQTDVATFLSLVATSMHNYLERCFHPSRRPKPLFQAMRYSLLSGGKRLRPALCIATANAVGARESDVLPAAAALEMIHTYSLIHDDLPVMDNDDLRHGKPTSHKVYGEAMALLAGDALLTEAFAHLASQSIAKRRLDMILILAQAAGAYGMVAGQAADMLAENSSGDEADLEFIHLHKTGKLIMASVALGALHADIPGQVQRQFSLFGSCLGLLYQMVDDLLDVTGSTEQLGKTGGKDVHQHKLTYPALIGVDATRQRIQTTVTEALELLSSLPYDTRILENLCRYVVARDH
jgi:geranylgeranyl diphosphate synthase, type II